MHMVVMCKSLVAEIARIDFSRRGNPTDNAHVELFNGRLRDERPNPHWFVSMQEAERVIGVLVHMAHFQIVRRSSY